MYAFSTDDLIDVVMGNCIYMPCLYVYNKIDQISMEEVDRLARLPHSVGGFFFFGIARKFFWFIGVVYLCEIDLIGRTPSRAYIRNYLCGFLLLRVFVYV